MLAQPADCSIHALPMVSVVVAARGRDNGHADRRKNPRGTRAPVRHADLAPDSR
jgi:hypothetical protein